MRDSLSVLGFGAGADWVLIGNVLAAGAAKAWADKSELESRADKKVKVIFLCFSIFVFVFNPFFLWADIKI